MSSDLGTSRRARLREARLCVIVGARRDGFSALRVATEALAGGARLLQLRDKTASRRALLAQAEAIVPLCAVAGALLIVNDAADVALAAGADGVHGGDDDLPANALRRLVGPDRLVGATAHDAAEAARGAALGADYLGIGTVYESGTKPGLPVRGLEILREALASARGVPIFAIGGITRERVSEVLATGVHGVAVGAAIVEAADIARETVEFLEALARLHDRVPRSPSPGGRWLG